MRFYQRIWPWRKFLELNRRAWLMEGALGYPQRYEFGLTDATPNPYKCGLCDARKANPWLYRKGPPSPVERGVIEAALGYANLPTHVCETKAYQEALARLKHACEQYTTSEKAKNFYETGEMA